MSKFIIMKNKEPVCEFVVHDNKDMVVRSHTDRYGYMEMMDDSGQYLTLHLSERNRESVKRVIELLEELYKTF